MANIKISQLPAKGANLEATDLVEISEFTGTGYISKSITGQEIINAASGGGAVWGSITGILSDQTDLNSELLGKQATLSSGVNIKTINSTSVLGSGDIAVQPTLVSGTNIKTINSTSLLGSGNLTIGGGGVHFITKPISGQYFSGQLVNGLATTTQSTAANRMTLMPIIPKTSFTASNFTINVLTAAAGSLLKILIYTDLNGTPSTKLYQSTDLDCSTTGLKTATASSFVFNADTIYWVGSISNQVGAQFAGFPSGSTLPLGVSTAASTMNYFVQASSFNFLVPPAGPISPVAFGLASSGHAGIFIQAL